MCPDTSADFSIVVAFSNEVFCAWPYVTFDTLSQIHGAHRLSRVLTVVNPGVAALVFCISYPALSGFGVGWKVRSLASR